MTPSIGSLVTARGRDWVVLPESQGDLLVVRPLGGTDDEIAGLWLPLESVRSTTFALPDPEQVGDHRSGRLLRDAARLSTRSCAGPFRSAARIAVEPRPYQLVPLLMALRLDPVRLLIADDVGIGKTIEAGLVARELLDRGEIPRLAVLCPPHLAEQWQGELRDKFQIEAELVLSSTAQRLEEGCDLGESLFDRHRFVVVSTDFIKSDRRREDFARACPELVIVDEAHTCAYGSAQRGRHQRYELIRRLSEDSARHLILVTATPHSGSDETFRSLLSLLHPDFGQLPDDLSGPQNEPQRRRLAQHFVQRLRADVKDYQGATTVFPQRIESPDTELTYTLTPEYRAFFEKVLRFTRERVRDTSGGPRHQRVRWWSALALLRAVGSSPAAAASTLRNRSAPADAETVPETNALGQQTVLDGDLDDALEDLDVTPGADDADVSGETDEQQVRRRLQALAREAEQLGGESDHKLAEAVKLVRRLVNAGQRPILFCRFIPTAEYLAAQLREQLPGTITVEAVTGLLPPAERENRVLNLASADKPVLVCTDCLSEGVNLQHYFDTVVHYDLAWNPTRHEQRAGRVDRYGQPRAEVQIWTLYGRDNPIDGIVLDVLIRKHKRIRKALGIAVPVPAETTASVLEAILEGLVLREQAGSLQLALAGMEEYAVPQRVEFHSQWDAAGEREKRSRTLFAQHGIKVEEVEREWSATRQATGAADVPRFVQEVLAGHGAHLTQAKGLLTADLSELPGGLRETLDAGDSFQARFELPVSGKALYLHRTHRLVETLANQVLDGALDPESDGLARRAGAIRTAAVTTRTTLLLARFRYHLTTTARDGEPQQVLAEECRVLGFTGAPESAVWLDPDDVEKLLDAAPGGNIDRASAVDFVRRVVAGFDQLAPHLDEEARRGAAQLLDAHRRVRVAARHRGIRYEVEPLPPPDLLGIYVYLPLPGGTQR